jgi:hypothetical protein
MNCVEILSQLLKYTRTATRRWREPVSQLLKYTRTATRRWREPEAPEIRSNGNSQMIQYLVWREGRSWHMRHERTQNVFFAAHCTVQIGRLLYYWLLEVLRVQYEMRRHPESAPENTLERQLADGANITTCDGQSWQMRHERTQIMTIRQIVLYLPGGPRPKLFQ